VSFDSIERRQASNEIGPSKMLTDAILSGIPALSRYRKSASPQER